MVELTGDTALCGVLVRELLARGVDVSGAKLDADRRPARPDRILVVAEGVHDALDALAEATRAVELWGGALLFATARQDDDPAVVALRRRGIPYTIVRAGGLVELPSDTSTRWVLVPSDLDRAPFSTLDDLGVAVARVVAADEVGSGRLVDVTSHAGARDWARALTAAGARAHVVPRWVAMLAAWLGIPRLDVVGRDVRFVVGARAPAALPALGA